MKKSTHGLSVFSEEAPENWILKDPTGRPIQNDGVYPSMWSEHGEA
jgi:hypothetical protein